MSGLFDRLKAELGGDDDEPSGITPLEIADLPQTQRRILLWMLRDRTASAEGISAENVQQRLENAPPDCAVVMAQLARDGWLIKLGESPGERYKVNLRRKKGSNSSFGLWSILADRISPDTKDS